MEEFKQNFLVTVLEVTPGFSGDEERKTMDDISKRTWVIPDEDREAIYDGCNEWALINKNGKRTILVTRIG